MSNSTQPRWHIGALTDVGVKRRGRPNEDALGVASQAGPRPPLLVVADGMGGYEGGATASNAVVETFQREYNRAPAGRPATEILEVLVRTAHAELSRIAGKNQALASMGSTVVAALLGAERIAVINVGDSRAYLLRGGVLRQVSTDHSQVAALQQAGQLTAEAARHHPQRSVLTMSLSPKRKDVYPSVVEAGVEEGDTLLLCSDGLWSTLSESEIATVLGGLEPQAAAEKLVELANMSQAPDNIAVIVARLGKRQGLGAAEDPTDH